MLYFFNRRRQKIEAKTAITLCIVTCLLLPFQVLFSAQHLIAISQSWPIRYTTFVDNPNSLSHEHILKEKTVAPVTVPDGPFMYPPRPPKSAQIHSEEVAAKYDSEHPLLKRMEALGAGKEQVKQAIRHVLEDKDKDKGFFSKMMDKVKDFLSRFITFY